MIKKLTNAEAHVIAENSGLSAYLLSLQEDMPFTHRSWLYEEVKDPDTILDNWLSILRRLKAGNQYEMEVYEFELTQLEKWGPQGGHESMDTLYPSLIEPMFAPQSLVDQQRTQAVFSGNQWKKAVSQTIDYLGSYTQLHALRPSEFHKIVDKMRSDGRLESNSGWPVFARRNTPEAKQQAISAATSGEWIKFPAIALFRRYNNKTRLVWMYPMAANVVENTYIIPLQTKFLNASIPFFAPWEGFEAVQREISAAYSAGKFIYASDFASTDAHFRLQASLSVAPVIAAMFQDKYSVGLEESITRMHVIPLVISRTEKVVGEHGVSSGSSWTNLIETVFDLTLSRYVSIQLENQVTGMYAIGDDMSWISDKFDDAFPEKLEKYGKDVGQVVKADKTTCFPDKVKTLQRLFQRGYNRRDGLCRGVYPTIRALKSSVFPERSYKRKSWNSDMFCVRQFAILENCVDHPLFSTFCEFVAKGNRHLIPFAKQSASKLDSLYREAKLLPGLVDAYNQEKRDKPLSSFSSIKIVSMM